MERSLRLRALLAPLAIAAPVFVDAALGPRYGGEAIVALPAVPASLDPARPADAAHRLVLGLVHETLVEAGDDGRLRPGLARAWSRGAGEREWVLELEPDARFHDDAPVTSDDVLRSLRRFLDAPGPAATLLADALAPEGLSAPDAAHVALRFRDSRPDALLPLASLAAAVTSASGAGAGPFLPTHRVPGQRLALTAFAEHVRGRPYLDRVTLTAVADEARRTADVAAARADAALDAGPPLSDPSGFATLVLAFDATRPPFDAAAARAAVARAVRTADVPAFVPGAVAIPAGLPPMGGATPPRGLLALTVATDVPPTASQRVFAVLESLGASVSTEARAPEAARAAETALRLLLEAPEVPGAAAAAEERRALSRGVLDAVLPIASLPTRLATASRLHAVRIGPDGGVRLEDAWVDP